MAIVLANSVYYTIVAFADDVVLPPFGLALGGRSVSSLLINLTPGQRLANGPVNSLSGARWAGAAVIAYGEVIVQAIHCLIALLLMLFVLRWVGRARSGTPDADLGLDAPHPRESV